eukprot:scaffold8826_cov117-Isochrysis_galbana.AAC.4
MLTLWPLCVPGPRSKTVWAGRRRAELRSRGRKIAPRPERPALRRPWCAASLPSALHYLWRLPGLRLLALLAPRAYPQRRLGKPRKHQGRGKSRAASAAEQVLAKLSRYKNWRPSAQFHSNCRSHRP